MEKTYPKPWKVEFITTCGKEYITADNGEIVPLSLIMRELDIIQKFAPRPSQLANGFRSEAEKLREYDPLDERDAREAAQEFAEVIDKELCLIPPCMGWRILPSSFGFEGLIEMVRPESWTIKKPDRF